MPGLRQSARLAMGKVTICGAQKQVKLNAANLSATRQLDPAVKAQFDVVQKIELVLKVGGFQLRCQGREDQSRSLGSTTSRRDGVHHGR